MIPTYARYEYCISKAIDFILNESLNKFPFDSDKIIKKHRWSRRKYTQQAKEYNLNINDVIEAFGSQDGYTIFNGRNYTISYNDTHIPGRIYFTKLHEIGHIYLNHFIDFNETIINRNSMSNNKYKVLENEANCFARNVIAPAIIVQSLGLDTPEKISQYFGITEGAARTRNDLLNLDLKYITSVHKNKLLEFWGEGIYKKKCSSCNYGLTSKNTEYCPICGSKNLIWGDDHMKYDFINLNDLNKAIICPTCENENTNIEGEYCQICGSHIKNLCGFCGEELSGDARFCNHCGSISKFFENGYLADWKIAQQDINDELTIDEFTSNHANIYQGDMPF